MRKLANVFLAFVILGLLLRLAAVAEEAKGAAVPPEARINTEPFAVECTAYCDEGDIPRGETVDIFMEDYDRCMEWGRREVYVQIIRGQG